MKLQSLPNPRPLFTARFAGFLLVTALLLHGGATGFAAGAAATRVVNVAGDDLQATIDRAKPGDIVLADPNHEIVVRQSIRIDKPLTLLGLRARLIAGLGATPLLIVTGDEFRMADFRLTGNRASIDPKERAALLQIRGSRFVVERGIVENSSKDGIEITIVEGGRDVRDGAVRDIVGFDNDRDHVSISALGRSGLRIRNLVVQNIRAYRSRSRGAVEVSDGTENITVQDVYAENCVYAVDVQDHSRAGESNLGVRLLNVFARGCLHAVRTKNQAGLGHRDLTLRNVSGDQWPDGAVPIQVSHTHNVVIDDVRIREGKAVDTPVLIKNCRNVTVQTVTLEELTAKTDTIRIEDSGDVRLRNIFLGPAVSAASDTAIRFRLTTPGAFGHLRIQDVITTSASRRIVLERAETAGVLDSYRVSYDPALVDDRIKGANGRITPE